MPSGPPKEVLAALWPSLLTALPPKAARFLVGRLLVVLIGGRQPAKPQFFPASTFWSPIFFPDPNIIPLISQSFPCFSGSCAATPRQCEQFSNEMTSTETHESSIITFPFIRLSASRSVSSSVGLFVAWAIPPPHATVFFLAGRPAV